MSIIKAYVDGCHRLGIGEKLTSVSKQFAMPTSLHPEINELLDAVHYRPAVSIIMPFEPKMGSKEKLSHSLRLAADKVAYELLDNYPYEICILITEKINAIIKKINFNTHKKSIALFVSPVFEKILYLDIVVEEKIIIDESFEIRDLVYNKKQLHEYLVLLLSSKESFVYLAKSGDLIAIMSDKATAHKENEHEKIANFSDAAKRKEIMMEKFLQHTSNSLDIILKNQHLPLFVLGTERILGHYKKLSRHTSSVIEYIHGNYEEASTEELKKLLVTHITDWEKLNEKYLFNLIEAAADKKHLATGIKNVWKQVTNKRGRLLIVEKSYTYTAEHGSSDELIYKAIEPYNKFSYIKDAVDDVIEKVLENGGDVEFVNDGVLQDYHKIVLIQYY